MITPQKFHTLFPKARNAEGWCAAFTDMFPAAGLTTPERQAMFIAQCGHESVGWSKFEENLNYSAKRLREVFGKYFPTDKLAAQYERHPQKIASRVYGGRMGNGPEDTGDGWKYRGRGAIQLTGKSNYLAFSNDVFGSNVIADNPDAVATDLGTCLQSAFWYWKVRNIASVDGDVPEATRRINGGKIGLAARTALYQEVLRAL